MAKKLSLDLTGLKVESFETFVSDRDARGTVRANLGCITWSCGGTCGAAPDSELEKNAALPPTFLCGSGTCCA